MSQALTAGVLCASRRLLQSGVRIEEQLARTLQKCDALGQPLCEAVAKTLTKLVQDIAGMPLVLAEFLSDPHALSCTLVVLHEVLESIKPDQVRSAAALEAAEAAARKLCQQRHLPVEVGELAVVLVDEIALAFQQLDRVLQPPYVTKTRNANILRARVHSFLRKAQADIFVVAFASIKLAVCMRALAEGCFQLRHGDKRLLHGLLEQLHAKARTIAALNKAHRDSLTMALLMARTSQRRQV